MSPPHKLLPMLALVLGVLACLFNAFLLVVLWLWKARSGAANTSASPADLNTLLPQWFRPEALRRFFAGVVAALPERSAEVHAVKQRLKLED